ncbi:MAG: hypothetical protein K6C34_04670 [Alphaproteobacteria bacterium]|nr:hypothetical protein [Alphaproteobacteria bacterium]
MMSFSGITSAIIRKIKTSYSKFHIFASKLPFYSLTLISSNPDRIFNKLNLSFPSEYSIDLITQSHIVVLKCSGKSIFIRNIPKILLSSSISTIEKAELHSFGWISLLNLDADKQWRLMIRNHIKFWMSHFKFSDDIAWSTPVTSERLYNWIVQYNLISKTSDIKFNDMLVKSISRQFKLLRRQLYLPLKMTEKTSLIRALAVTAAAINDAKTVQLCLKELQHNLRTEPVEKSNYSTQELLKILRNLVDIQAVISAGRKSIPTVVTNTMAKIATIIRQIRHPDGGISIFKSEFTPSAEYVDAILSHVENAKFQDFNAGYLTLRTFEGTTFINLNDKYFPIEFSFGIQRIVLGSYLYFTDRNLNFSNTVEIKHSVIKEKSNVWFSGNSRFKINDANVNFEKSIYINNLGTDMRCEEKLSDNSLNVIHYIILPSDVEITPLEYQNGFFMDLRSGIRWCWSFDKDTKLSFDFERNAILNGKKVNVTLLSITTSEKNFLRWTLKKI